jgi:hypothetical protein
MKEVMEFDASIDRWVREYFWPALMGSLAAFAYLALLARAQVRARVLVALLGECRRRIVRQEERRAFLGHAPRLEYYRRLEQELVRRLAEEGVRV